MYSRIAYFIASKVVDIIVKGLDESKAVIIVSEKSTNISEAISRLEIAKLKNIVHGFDKDALITMASVKVSGKNIRRSQYTGCIHLSYIFLYTCFKIIYIK